MSNEPRKHDSSSHRNLRKSVGDYINCPSCECPNRADDLFCSFCETPLNRKPGLSSRLSDGR